jgi:Nucleotidyl transferase AbiEii toxin, Type IV TA system
LDKFNQPTKLPLLEFLSWQITDIYRLTQAEMLARYERGWRYRHQVEIPAGELAFIKQLALDQKSWLTNEFMDFKVNRHQIIHRILAGLNYEFLNECQAYFGGGTLISLDLGEYRTSNDIDFICAYGADYRKLRNTITECSPRILLRDNSIEISRFMADQYGVRMAIVTNGVTIKTEIIAEARFGLDLPRQPAWSPVKCLSISDCFTSKLLANADRYADGSVYSRDLIDLAFLRIEQPIPTLAIEKAEAAYGVIPALTTALSKFQENTDLRFRCYENLNISEGFRSQLIDGIDLLAIDLGLRKTTRTISELIEQSNPPKHSISLREGLANERKNPKQIEENVEID